MLPWSEGLHRVCEVANTTELIYECSLATHVTQCVANCICSGELLIGLPSDLALINNVGPNLNINC